MRSAGLFSLGVLVACAHPQPHEATMDASQAKAEINRVLDDWHDAAARSDEARYFGHFAADGIFLGTDATERWDVAAFRAYAQRPFAEGRGWVMRSIRREIALGPGLAWFDEDLETKNLGPARGSGVLRREGGTWKIVQYNLAITVPNERFEEVKSLLAAPPPR